MTRDEFMEQLESGKSATMAVYMLTGTMPVVVPVAEYDDGEFYLRYGVMMSHDLMAGLVILRVHTGLIPPELIERIRSGEPAGKVLRGMERIGFVQDLGTAVRSGAKLILKGVIVGEADEVFTESLFARRLSA